MSTFWVPLLDIFAGIFGRKFPLVIDHLVSGPQQNSRKPRFLSVLDVAWNGRLVLVRFCQSSGSVLCMTVKRCSQ